MEGYRFRKTNHYAVFGFLAPFGAAGAAALLVLFGDVELRVYYVKILYLTVVPFILFIGLIASIKSIPLIRERDDADYAYAGLTLNILFILVYTLSLFHFFFLQ